VAAAALALLLLLAAVSTTLTLTPAPGEPALTPSPSPASGRRAGGEGTPTAEAIVARDLSGRCVPEPGRAACDPVRAALWAGDVEAWRTWAAARGDPPPTPAQVQTATINLRLGAGDPAARIDLARATGQPLLLITAVRLRLLNGRALVTGVELSNPGAAPADLSGVEVAGGAARLAPGTALPPGGRCAVGVGSTSPCPLAPAGPGLAGAFVPVLLVPGEAVHLRAPDGRLLDEFVLP
jgi:hypothetical protein